MPNRISRRRAGAQMAVAVGALAAGSALYAWQVDFAGDIVAIELGGNGQAWPPPDSGLSSALWWDFAFIAGFGICLLLLTDLARRLFWTSTARALAVAGAACAATAVLADIVEDVLLLTALQWPDAAGVPLALAAGAAAVKFSVLLVAAPVAVVALLTTLYRLLAHKVQGEADTVTVVEPSAATAPGLLSTLMPEQSRAEGEAPHPEVPPELVVRRQRWTVGYQVPGIEEELRAWPPGTPRVGVAVSGGGIRSASLTMGALQGLRETLLRARYLTSVSGGGYTAGALQLALQPPRDEHGEPTGLPAAAPSDVFLQGTPEEDHVRRHSSYIADGAAQWVLAFGVVLRGLLASLLLVTCAVAAVGVSLGLFYGVVPLSDRLGRLAPESGGVALPYPEPGQAVVVALAGVTAAAGVAYLLSLLALSGTGRWWQLGRVVARGLAALALLLLVVGVGIPALVWASTAVITLGDGDVATTAGVGGGGTVLLSYVAALTAMAWRRRKALGKLSGRFRKTGDGGAQLVAGGPAQRLLVTAVLSALCAVFLLILGSTIGTAAGWQRSDGWTTPGLLIGAITVLALLGAGIDQTWLSLHPFYRRRLASAFATRRSENGEAVPYDYAVEKTTLSTYGKRRPGFPEVVFCCAANVSGQQYTPPGRRVVSYTMSAEWVGGPDVGYLATADAEQVSAHLGRDLTVQAAMAISGAAFASAMGRKARSAQTLLALTNARLGSWLPNPRFVRSRQEETSWWTPRLPSLRRVTYLLREVFGVYRADERLLYTTDGGHYENLALVELLRRRCTEIYCIDGSDDRPPLAGALGEALSLAYEELGVRIVLDAPTDLVAGSADPLAPTEPLAALNGRLARSGVVRGRVLYPAESGLVDREGVIYLAKAVLTSDLPYELLSYSAEHPAFPRDSTGDQWFDSGQFSAYVELGRQLAEQVLQAQERAAESEDARDGLLDRQRP